MKITLKSSYGCTATVTVKPDGSARLVCKHLGKTFHDKIYATLRGAKIAWGRMG
jgi:hypothetical protein